MSQQKFVESQLSVRYCTLLATGLRTHNTHLDWSSAVLQTVTVTLAYLLCASSSICAHLFLLQEQRQR